MSFQHRLAQFHIFWIRIFCEKEITIRQIPYDPIRMTIYAFFIIPRYEKNFATEQTSQFCKKFTCRIMRIGLNYFVNHDNSIITHDYIPSINNYVRIYHFGFIT